MVEPSFLSPRGIDRCQGIEARVDQSFAPVMGCGLISLVSDHGEKGIPGRVLDEKRGIPFFMADNGHLMTAVIENPAADFYNQSPGNPLVPLV